MSNLLGDSSPDGLCDPIGVEVDIKPGGDTRNAVPSRGHAWVAVLSSGDVDTAAIDPGTVRFGPTEATPLQWQLRDVNKDKADDLVMRFAIADTGLTLNNEDGCINGELFDGSPIFGCDSITVIGGPASPPGGP